MTDITMAEDNSLLKIHLRLRHSKTLNKDTDDAYYVDKDDPGTLVATAPQHTETHKNAQRNQTLAIQKFKFSNIFVPKTAQSELFEATTVPLLDECLNMENNCLLFTYGVTNSGKTHTVQGPRNDAGLLPRSLDLIFNTIGSHIKPKSIYCPHLHNDVCKMTEKLQHQKEALKQRILYPPNTSQEINLTGITDPNSTKCTVGSMISEYDETSYQITDNVTVQLNNADNVEYSIWVSYVELYNENIYDLLHPPTQQGVMKPKDRPTLRLGEDRSMSVYIKGATQLEVCSFAEASRVLSYGQRNRKIAATSANQSSSRSHAIFRISIIATNTESQQSKCSQFTFVDLAGSERHGKTNAVGVRLKEAGNINTSLLTLGKCMSALRHNSKLKPGRAGCQGQIVPFRESKLTRLFKTFLSGEGRITMIVCVNVNPDMFDETIHALKFSALASETMLIPQPSDMMLGSSGKDSNKMTDQEIERLRWDIRDEILAEVNQIRKRERLQNEELLEETKARERRYYEGLEEDLQEYYANVIEQLKDKVRQAREGHGGTNNGAEKDNIIKELQEECARLKKDLVSSRSEHEQFKADLDQTLFHTKLELKTTQQLYNAGMEEKDRLLKLLSGKELENKELFQINEETTKSATFWEKEYNTLKVSRAQQLDEHAVALKQHQCRIDQLESELHDKASLIETLGREKLQQSGTSAEVAKLTNQLQALKDELVREKQTNMNSLELLTTANSRNTELEREMVYQKEQCDLKHKEIVDGLKSSMEKDKSEICRLQKTQTDSTEVISNLKQELYKLQRVLSSQDNKENLKKENINEIRADLLKCRELLVEKNNTIKELQEELNDLVRNKSLQFDTLISNKEKECEELTTKLETKGERILELQRRIVELESLAGVQKNHLMSVERDGNEEKEALKRRIAELEETVKQKADVCDKTPLDEGKATSDEDRLAEVERLSSKLRIEAELAKQECDRLKIELATAYRKASEDVKQVQLTLDAKNIELENWYTEKEKAVAMISSKKEKEIYALEEKLCELQQKLIEKDNIAKQEDSVAAITPAGAVTPAAINFDEQLKTSTEKLTDMVVQLEEERDNIRAEYDQYVAEMNTAITGKESEFRELRANLTSKADQVTELEATVEQLKREMASVTRRHKTLSTESDLDLTYNNGKFQNIPVRRSNRKRCKGSVSSADSTRTSIKSTSSRTSTRKQRSSNRSASRRSSTIRATRSTRSTAKRTSQISLKSLNTTRSKKSRIQPPIPESPGSDFMTPEPVSGLKRKTTLKGIKNFITGSSPRPSKKGKCQILDISESDSGTDFVTPTQTTKATQGKRKLHKSQISTPQLIPSPVDMNVRDVEKPTTETKTTRSHTKLIQQHLSGSGMMRKTRSRNTKI